MEPLSRWMGSTVSSEVAWSPCGRTRSPLSVVLGHVKGVTIRLTIDARGRLVPPGFVNGHTHVPVTLLRGMRDDVPLDEWLQKYIFPAEAKNVTEDFGHTACRRRANSGWPHHVCRYVFLKMPLPRRRKQQGCARCLAKRCAEADARRGPEFLASTGNCQRMIALSSFPPPTPILPILAGIPCKPWCADWKNAFPWQ